jgi:putative FmdB family regulatory protein
MPLFDYICPKCGKSSERFLPMNHDKPVCCGEVMTRQYTTEFMKVKMKYPGWIDKIDDIHKAQEQRGERLRFVHPREVGAT